MFNTCPASQTYNKLVRVLIIILMIIFIPKKYITSHGDKYITKSKLKNASRTLDILVILSIIKSTKYIVF